MNGETEAVSVAPSWGNQRPRVWSQEGREAHLVLQTVRKSKCSLATKPGLRSQEPGAEAVQLIGAPILWGAGGLQNLPSSPFQLQLPQRGESCKSESKAQNDLEEASSSLCCDKGLVVARHTGL
jgi:hypothetical protein